MEIYLINQFKKTLDILDYILDNGLKMTANLFR